MKLMDAIKGHLLDLKISGTTEKHIREVRRELERFRQWCEEQQTVLLDDVTPMILKGYIAFLQDLRITDDDPRISLHGRKLSAITIQDYMRKIRSFFFWAERKGYLSGANPVQRIPKVKVPTYVIPTFTPQQLQALLDTCDMSTPLGFRDYTILLVFMDTGIRVSELIDLVLDNVHEGYLLVLGKGNKEREVGLGETGQRALFKYIHQYRKPATETEQHAFLSFTGRPLCRKDVWQILHDVAEKAGIKGVRASPHTLRHTFATQWLENGGDLASVSLLLGHTEIQTTQSYLKSFQSREARQHHKHFSPVEKNKLGRHTIKKRGKKKLD
jgi:site-specific recombinase XerD